MIELYKYLCEANMKNTVLVKSQQEEEPVDRIEMQNVKNEVVLVQFKLVDKNTLKPLNTFTFLNLPATKQSDANVSCLEEILQKQNEQVRKRATRDYLPYNKSILTRILYP